MLAFLDGLGNYLPEFAGFLRNEPSWSPISGVTWGRYLSCLGILFVTFVLRGIIARGLTQRLLGLTKKTKTDIDDRMILVVKKPLGHLFVLGGVYLAVRALEPSAAGGAVDTAFRILRNGLYLANLVVVGMVALRLIDALSIFMAAQAEKTDTKLDDQLVPMVRKSLKVFAVLIIAVVFLQNLDYDVSGLIASLGIGGLAFALAAKDTVANLFGSLTIFTDRPFQIGDFVKVKGVSGTVEEVGFRSTRIRTSDNVLVSIPNSDFSSDVIENMSARRQRRLEFTIGLTYETTAEALEGFIEALRTLFREHEAFASARAHLTGFGSSALEISVVAITKKPDFLPFMETRQEMFLAVMRLCAEHEVEMAFDSRAIYFRGNEDSMIPTVRVV